MVTVVVVLYVWTKVDSPVFERPDFPCVETVLELLVEGVVRQSHALVNLLGNPLHFEEKSPVEIMLEILNAEQEM